MRSRRHVFAYLSRRSRRVRGRDPLWRLNKHRVFQPIAFRLIRRAQLQTEPVRIFFLGHPEFSVTIRTVPHRLWDFSSPPPSKENGWMPSRAGSEKRVALPTVRLLSSSESIDRDGPNYGRITAPLHLRSWRPEPRHIRDADVAPAMALPAAGHPPLQLHKSTQKFPVTGKVASQGRGLQAIRGF